MVVCHLLGFSSVLSLKVGIIDRANIAEFSINGSRRTRSLSERGECPLLTEVLLAIRRSIRENDQVLLIVGVRPLNKATYEYYCPMNLPW